MSYYSELQVNFVLGDSMRALCNAKCLNVSEHLYLWIYVKYMWINPFVLVAKLYCMNVRM